MNNIEKWRMRVLLSSLELEIVGMKRLGRSAYSIIKEEFNLKGNKKKVYSQLRAMIKEGTNEG